MARERDTQFEYQQRKAAADRRGLTVRSQTTLRRQARQEGFDPTRWESENYDFGGIQGDLEDRHGIQGPSGPSPDPDWDYYWPTRTKTPPGRKYTQFARYSRKLERMEVTFRDGTPWHWDGVPVQMWSAFKFSWEDTHSFIRTPGAPIQIWGRGEFGGFGKIE